MIEAEHNPSDRQPKLESERLTLEPLVEEHAALTFDLWQDEHLYTFIPFTPPADVASLERRYRMLSGRRSPDGTEEWLNWFVRERSSSAYVGLIQVTISSGVSAYLAYFTFTPYWGRGYANEACRAALHFLFESGVQEIVAEIDTRNIASIRLIEKLGFTQVAYTPGAAEIRGEMSDEYRYVLTIDRATESNLPAGSTQC